MRRKIASFILKLLKVPMPPETVKEIVITNTLVAGELDFRQVNLAEMVYINVSNTRVESMCFDRIKVDPDTTRIILNGKDLSSDWTNLNKTRHQLSRMGDN